MNGNLKVALVMPVRAAQITQGWGENPAYYARYGQAGHNGIDMVSANGDLSILAAAEGVVQKIAAVSASRSSTTRRDSAISGDSSDSGSSRLTGGCGFLGRAFGGACSSFGSATTSAGGGEGTSTPAWRSCSNLCAACSMRLIVLPQAVRMVRTNSKAIPAA